jgi:hypothetical protein
MFMAKSVLDEQHPAYVGMYDGALMNEDVRRFVEDSDLIINVGSPMTDFNTGAFTAHLDPTRTIAIATSPRGGERQDLFWCRARRSSRSARKTPAEAGLAGHRGKLARTCRRRRS